MSDKKRSTTLPPKASKSTKPNPGAAPKFEDDFPTPAEGKLQKELDEEPVKITDKDSKEPFVFVSKPAIPGTDDTAKEDTEVLVDGFVEVERVEEEDSNGGKQA